jgi:hypothetical protein
MEGEQPSSPNTLESSGTNVSSNNGFYLYNAGSAKKRSSIRKKLFPLVTPDGNKSNSANKLESPSKKNSNSVFLKVKFPPTKVSKVETALPSEQSTTQDLIDNNNQHSESAKLTGEQHPVSTPSVAAQAETITYPFEFKVVCLDKNCNVIQAIRCIQTTFKLQTNEYMDIGLYNPFDKKWLEDKTSLKDIVELPMVVSEEFLHNI